LVQIGPFFQSLVQIGPVVLEELIKMQKANDRRTRACLVCDISWILSLVRANQTINLVFAASQVSTHDYSIIT
jgi:hypothetical protein